MSARDRTRIDEFLPIYDVSASYEIRVHAPPSIVYQCLLRSDFNDLWLVRLLMTIRTGKRQPQNRVLRDLTERLQGTGFVILDDVPREELVIVALQENSGVPMAGAVSTLLRVILLGLLVPDMQRQRGISDSGSSLNVRCFQPKRGSNASVERHSGSFAPTGFWSPRSPA